jgi:hypothetical protein
MRTSVYAFSLAMLIAAPSTARGDYLCKCTDTFEVYCDDGTGGTNVTKRIAFDPRPCETINSGNEATYFDTFYRVQCDKHESYRCSYESAPSPSNLTQCSVSSYNTYEGVIFNRVAARNIEVKNTAECMTQNVATQGTSTSRENGVLKTTRSSWIRSGQPVYPAPSATPSPAR